jgi:hypothetical protein
VGQLELDSDYPDAHLRGRGPALDRAIELNARTERLRALLEGLRAVDQDPA